MELNLLALESQHKESTIHSSRSQFVDKDTQLMSVTAYAAQQLCDRDRDRKSNVSLSYILVKVTV